MKIIARARGGGKTTEIVQRFIDAAAPGVFLVVAGESEKRRIVREFNLWDLEGRIVTFAEASSGRRFMGYNDPAVFVDNVDAMFRYFVGARVEAVSYTDAELGVDLEGVKVGEKPDGDEITLNGDFAFARILLESTIDKKLLVGAWANVVAGLVYERLLEYLELEDQGEGGEISEPTDPPNL